MRSEKSHDLEVNISKEQLADALSKTMNEMNLLYALGILKRDEYIDELSFDTQVLKADQDTIPLRIKVKKVEEEVKVVY